MSVQFKSGYQRIEAAKLANEYVVLQLIRGERQATGRRWQPRIGLTPVKRYNAIERLVAKGTIRYVRSRSNPGYEVQ